VRRKAGIPRRNPKEAGQGGKDIKEIGLRTMGWGGGRPSYLEKTAGADTRLTHVKPIVEGKKGGERGQENGIILTSSWKRTMHLKGNQLRPRNGT